MSVRTKHSQRFATGNKEGRLFAYLKNPGVYNNGICICFLFAATHTTSPYPIFDDVTTYQKVIYTIYTCCKRKTCDFRSVQVGTVSSELQVDQNELPIFAIKTWISSDNRTACLPLRSREVTQIWTTQSSTRCGRSQPTKCTNSPKTQTYPLRNLDLLFKKIFVASHHEVVFSHHHSISTW